MSIIFLIAALVFFILAAMRRQSRFDLTAIGLACVVCASLAPRLVALLQ